MQGRSLSGVWRYRLAGIARTDPHSDSFGSWDCREGHASNEPRKTGQATRRCRVYSLCVANDSASESSPNRQRASLRPGTRLWSCGRDAARALARRIGSRVVACEERDRDRYGRIVAVCRVAGKDVNAWMAAEGWAFAYRRYSMRYVGEEAAAKAARRGTWRGDVVAPWAWRRGERLTGARTVAQPAASRPAAEQRSGRCAIKGNIG